MRFLNHNRLVIFRKAKNVGWSLVTNLWAVCSFKTLRWVKWACSSEQLSSHNFFIMKWNYLPSPVWWQRACEIIFFMYDVQGSMTEVNPMSGSSESSDMWNACVHLCQNWTNPSWLPHSALTYFAASASILFVFESLFLRNTKRNETTIF